MVSLIFIAFIGKSGLCRIHQGDKLGVWLADAREEEGVRCHNHNQNQNQNHKHNHNENMG